MRRVLGSRIALLIACGLLLAALVPLTSKYRHSVAWRVSTEHAAKVEQVLGRGAQMFGESPDEFRRHTRPRIEQVGNQTCISLVTHRSDGAGNYTACYGRDGSIMSERAIGCSFGAESLWDRFGLWVW